MDKNLIVRKREKERKNFKSIRWIVIFYRLLCETVKNIKEVTKLRERGNLKEQFNP